MGTHKWLDVGGTLNALNVVDDADPQLHTNGGSSPLCAETPWGKSLVAGTSTTVVLVLVLVLVTKY